MAAQQHAIRQEYGASPNSVVLSQEAAKPSINASVHKCSGNERGEIIMKISRTSCVLAAVFCCLCMPSYASKYSSEGLARQILAIQTSLESFSATIRAQVNQNTQINRSLIEAANHAITECGGTANPLPKVTQAGAAYAIMSQALVECGGNAEDEGSTYTLHGTKQFQNKFSPSQGMVVEHFKTCKGWAPFNESLKDRGDCEVTGDLTYLGKEITQSSVKCRATCNDPGGCSGSITTKGTCARPYPGHEPEGLSKTYTASKKSFFQEEAAPTQGVNVKVYKSCKSWEPFEETATSPGSCDVTGDLSYLTKWTEAKTGAITCVATCKTPGSNGRCAGTVKASLQCARK
jgi:hypothetical protein